MKTKCILWIKNKQIEKERKNKKVIVWKKERKKERKKGRKKERKIIRTHTT